MYLKQLEAIRIRELGTIMQLMQLETPAGARILEIGAGTGWQAQIISQAGFAVDAIDMPSSVYAPDRVFPIRNYDGHRIPFAEATFDVVYSSNVLEHVAHAKAFQREIHRVLKPDGIAIHVVPSGSWRLWSNITHYPYIARRVFNTLIGDQPTEKCSEIDNVSASSTRPLRSILSRALIPPRDGEIGNALTEIYYFSRHRWNRMFRDNGWKIERCVANHLLYTTYDAFGAKLSLSSRKRLSRFLGSSCHIYLLRPTGYSGSAMQDDSRVLKP